MCPYTSYYYTSYYYYYSKGATMKPTNSSDHWVLALDGTCTACSGVGREVGRLASDTVAIRDLRDPEVAAWRAEASGSGASWTPTLLLFSGDSVKAWTGISMAARLARLIGPSRAWKVAELLGGEQQGVVHTVSPERRRFLALFPKALAGAVIASGALGSTALADTGAVPGSGQRDLLRGKKPVSTGSPSEMSKAKAAVFRSSEWQNSNRSLAADGSMFDPGTVITHVYGPQYAAVYMTWLGRQHAMTATYLVDLGERKVVHERRVDMTAGTDSRVNLMVMENDRANLKGYLEPQSGEVVIQGGDAGTLFKGRIDPSNGAITPASGYNSIPAASGDAGGVRADLFGLDLCETAVTALCGTGGGFACYGVCVGLGFVSGFAGLACAGICGLIAALGCAGAVEEICN